MFFILSKILAFILSPINWIVFLGILTFFTKDVRRKKRRLATTLVALLFFTNGFIAGKVLSLVEIDSIGRNDITKPYDVGILLGGMVSFKSDSTIINFNQNGDRLFQTIDLYKSGKIDKILITSGSGMIQLPSFKEANLIRQYLLKLDIPSSDIIIENRSNNTHENAVYSAEILRERYPNIDQRNFLLITSASHLRRGVACFEKQGIAVTPYSTTKRVTEEPKIFNSKWIFPDPYALQYWDIATHEIFGYWIYKVRGYV